MYCVNLEVQKWNVISYSIASSHDKLIKLYTFALLLIQQDLSYQIGFVDEHVIWF